MTGGTYVLLSGTITYGSALALALRELALLRRDKRRGAGGGWERAEPEPPKPLPLLGPEPPERALPPCLIPVLPPSAPGRRRAPELV